MLIYVEYITERLLYTLAFVFQDRKVPYELTNDGIAFIAASGPKINYSTREFDTILQIQPADLLFSDEIFVGKIDKGAFNDTPCLAFDGQADLLASIFYVLSRMEEYNSVQTDALGRFQAKASVCTQFNWLQEPICDVWCEALLAYLEEQLKLPFTGQKPRFYFQATFDIDNTFAYAHKNTIRTFFAHAKDLLYRRKERIKDRQLVRNGQKPDPYDTFDQISELAEHYPDLKVFWLLGNYTKLDKNISHLNAAQQDKIRQVAAHAEIGIHGSSLTQRSQQQLEIEIQRLEQIIGYRPKSNRQHFLLLHLPQTYKQLLQAGITHDYTMGYAEQTGFRAGTARTFKWFDLQKNEITHLNIHPFVYMDGTLLEYLRLSPEAAKKQIAQLYTKVQQHGGTFSFLWHNETIAAYQHWAPYLEVFKENFKLSQRRS
ncbi:MAG: polysaccharide deacetylase family protein [Flavobacteriales bacterium]